MTNDLIQLALKTLKCNQKQLAEKLGVSPAQITKWKKNEHMSSEMKDTIEKLIGIEFEDPQVVLAVHGLENNFRTSISFTCSPR